MRPAIALVCISTAENTPLVGDIASPLTGVEVGGPHQLNHADVVDDVLGVVLGVADAAARNVGLTTLLLGREALRRAQHHVPDIAPAPAKSLSASKL